MAAACRIAPRGARQRQSPRAASAHVERQVLRVQGEDWPAAILAVIKVSRIELVARRGFDHGAVALEDIERRRQTARLRLVDLSKRVVADIDADRLVGPRPLDEHPKPDGLPAGIRLTVTIRRYKWHLLCPVFF